MGVSFDLLKRKQILFRWDIIPFLIIYPLIFTPSVRYIQEAWIPGVADDPSNSTFAFIFDHVNIYKLETHLFPVLFPYFVVFAHIIILLLPYWNVDINIKMHYQVTTIEDATHVAFRPKKNHGKSEIVPLIRSNPPSAIFQQKKREYIDGKFVSLQYPTHEKISFYAENKGLTNAKAEKLQEKYGGNSYKIPIPSTWQLLKEQLISPLFVFQLFSNFLMAIDTYWYYPIVSMSSLIFTEWNNVKAKAANYLDLRGSEVAPIPIYTLRNGKWTKITSENIVPGDVVLIDKDISSPCDFLILRGRVVANEAMLTGESTPQLKDAVSFLPGDIQLDTEKHRRHILFSGTSVEQIIPSKESGLPAEGVVCFTLATGLGSAQGRLLRTILFGSARKTSDNTDSFKLLAFLSVFAVLADVYYVMKAKDSDTINSFRIVVEAITILTRTIPPDLPMQLSLQINTSLLSLTKLKIFCTESFRITYAGMVSVCCFDKTGTLTAEEYKLVGVDNLNAPPAKKNSKIAGNYFTCKDEMPKEILWVLGGCHSLVRDKYGNLIGDSVEEASFTGMKFKLNPDKTSQLGDLKIEPLKEYHFSSELRRMSVVCNITGQKKPIVVIKGAPEAIEELLTEVPEGYRNCYRSYTRQGCRVLALAYREYESENFNIHEKRDSIEKNFKFVGFSIFSAAIKRGSEDTIVSLLQSTHRVIVITGDDPLTACHVAKCLHIINKKPAIHDRTITDENGEEIDSDEGYAPCYTGRCLESLSPEEFTEAVKKCNVFARMSPSNKSSIIIRLNELGEKTLMCGDGTNDVGALKHAHVGIGLLEQATETDPETELMEQSGYKSKLGAASIASPFVSKRPTISACADLIRTGRACLSSASDLFRQLSLNALFDACISVVLMLENIRLNDRQYTAFSLLLTVVQFSIAFAKPRRQLSTERPFPSIFNGYLVSSILIQFAVHFIIFIILHKMVFAAGYKLDKFNYHSRFAPSLLNTCAFIYESVVQIVITIVNYRGKPFMQSFTENRLLLIGSFMGFGFIFIMLLDIVPFFSKYFKTVPFPSRTFQFEFIILMAADLVLSFLGDRLCIKLYSNKEEERIKNLVDPEIIESLEDYITNDDDILPEDLYDFGFTEMIKQNMVMQQNVAKKEMTHRRNEFKKNEYKRKLQEETKH